MFENAMFARPGLAIDPVHDGRHQLDDKPLERESMPYIGILPEEGIAFFVYTWVDKNSNAGAALAIFGPGVGAEPIQQRIADKPVSRDMNFSKWELDGFVIEQDLKFGSAKIRWENAQAVLDFSFEAFHPPYAYGSHRDGCPAYTAKNRIEQGGRVKGTLNLRGREIAFDTWGHRDHSWGTRDWKAFQHYKWFFGLAGDNTSVHFWQLHALGRTELRGYVFKERVMAEVTDVSVNWQGDKDYWQTQWDAVVTDEIGRVTTVHVDTFGHYPLIPDPAIVLNEAAGKAVIDGKSGVGWMEMAWPKDYLNHIIANSPY